MWEAVTDKFDCADINGQGDNVLKHMRRLWNSWSGSLHMIVKSKPLRNVLKDVPEGVDKSDWEWLVKEHFLSEKFKAEIQELVQSETSLTNIKVVKRCFGLQCKSNVVGFGGGITAKELKGGNSSKAALLDELNATRKENLSLKRHLDNLENTIAQLASTYSGQPSSTPSPTEPDTSI